MAAHHGRAVLLLGGPTTYDAFLLVSFGGPEKPEEVEPFLRNVLRGRNVPEERVREVASHYALFRGRSPINAQNRALLAALDAELKEKGPALKVYWGNRNWHPFLEETLSRMRDDGVRSALALVTSAFGSYSGCRQYRDDIDRARAAVGPDAPEVEKLRLFYNHPGFIDANAQALKAALAELSEPGQKRAFLLFTAHSLPVSMAAACHYEAQLEEACRLVADSLGRKDFALAFQSRSGPPTDPWLGPDVIAHIEALRGKGIEDIVVSPIGFVSDHMEVVYDLDVDVRTRALALGIHMSRAATVGVHPAFVSAIRELILERTEGATPRYVGPRRDLDQCSPSCCPKPVTKTRPGPPSA